MTIICLYLHGFIRTGGHRRYLELVQGLADRGNHTILLANRSLPHDLRGVEVISLDLPAARGRIPWSLRYRRAVTALLPQLRHRVPSADFVMVHGESHFFPALRVAHSYGAPLMFAFRSLPVVVGRLTLAEPGGSLRSRLATRLRVAKYAWYEKAIGRRAALIAFQSDYDRESYLSRVPAARPKTVVIRGNIGEPRFRAEAEATNNSSAFRTLLFMGGAGQRKGLQFLLQALADLNTRSVAPNLHILGSKDFPDQLQDIARRGGFLDRVSFLGWQSNPFPYLAAADLVIVPSLFDSYPDVILEAFHVGTAVVGSRVGGIPDMLHHDELMFEPQRPDQIAALLERLWSDPAFFQHVRSLSAQRRETFHFDWPAAWESAMRECVTP